MIPAARRSLYDVLRIVSSQVTLFLKKSSIFLLVAAVFNSTDVFKRCIDRYLKFIWKIALLVTSTVMYYNDVSTSMNCKHRGLRSGTVVIFFFTKMQLFKVITQFFLVNWTLANIISSNYLGPLIQD